MALSVFRHTPRGSVAADRLWQGAKRWGTAFALALFPLVFVLDGRLGGFSLVLPGVALVAVGLAVFPVAAMELAVWRNRHMVEATRRESAAARYALAGGVALGAAFLWLAAWFWGVV